MLKRIAVASGLAVLAVFVGTAVAGRGDGVERETLVRARVWCEAVEARDTLRFADAYRRGFFRGSFDRFANAYKEPSDAQILAAMPQSRSCEVDGRPRGPGERGDVYVAVKLDDGRTQLRMRREAGFWVVYQVVP